MAVITAIVEAFHRTVDRHLNHTSPLPLLPSEMAGQIAALQGILSTAANSLRRRRRRRRRSGGSEDGDREERPRSIAEAGSEVLNPDPGLGTVRSSFRLSFGSASEATTVLQLFDSEEMGQMRRKAEVLEGIISSAVSGAVVRFGYAEIRSATRGFDKGRELGRAKSRVYKGRIGVMRKAVAIKRVDWKDKDSVKDFCRELIIASSLRSRTVVPLIGFCVDNEGLFLVYKYVSGGTLDQLLYDQDKKGKTKVLSWKARYKVALGVAQALEYLHFGGDKCIIHRDIKPSNILLSSNGCPKLCDFGLATWSNGPSLPFLCKSVKGTFGYLAPEYFQHGKLSDKTDIYAFGVVLLELITGRKAIDRDRLPGEENLVLWAKPFLQQGEEAILKLVDPRLRCYKPNELLHLARAANACVKSEESRRPNICQVITILQGGDISNSDWSLLFGSSRFTRNGSQSHEHFVKSSMKRYLALAMLGVSDSEGGESYMR